MASRIASILSLTPDQAEELHKPAGRIKTLAEWLSEAVEATKDTPWFKLLGDAGEAAKEWSGTIKAVGKLIQKLTKETSPEVLGWLACTVAYRRAAEDAVSAYGRPASRIPYAGEILSARLKNIRLEDPSLMQGFSLCSAAGHPFLTAADKAFSAALEVTGYDPVERRNLLRTVRGRFKAVLQDVLSGEQKEKFSNFATWLQLDTDDQRLSAALLAHADLQRSQFEDKPGLGIEPFAISDVYIETECGVLQWARLAESSADPSGKTRIDPFAENSAQRQDVMDTVLGFMADRKFDDAIVIQGAPGAGKSTFTKKLCIRLHDEGLLPIRIPLQFLRVDANIFDAIQDVLVSFSDPSIGTFERDLLPDKVFSEQVEYGGSTISPYVFIFDGWDEISLSAAEGFQQRVERLLDRIRGTFLDQTRNRVRVVLTGRPSQAVGRSNFLRDDRPILTIRPITPEQLSKYLSDLRNALDKPAFTGSDIDSWKIGDIDRFTLILQRYRRDFPSTKELEVIGQPLLAHLAIKVMASFRGDLQELITPPTTLYRHLVDLTCKKAGKAPTDRDGIGKSGRIEGKDLRALLHGTALAITAHGSESIPEDELELRLETLGVGTDIFQLTRKQITKEHPLTNLMISFYFKGVHEQSGCEFLHKSFREYLAAEAIVEVLKEYATSLPEDLPQRAVENYWQDFREGDPRLWLSRKLGEILSPQWMSRDVATHVSELLRWEITRCKEKAPTSKTGKLSTHAITLVQWFKVRDALADLWDWWGEGVHLRVQPQEIQRLWKLDQPYVVKLTELAMRRWNAGRREPPRPPRTVTVDANLGYALFQLNCFVHAFISNEMGWMEKAKRLGASKMWSQITDSPRRYQVTVECENVHFVKFAPSGSSGEYFRNYVTRINAAGFVAVGPPELSQGGVRFDFPSQVFMPGVHLAAANLKGLTFSRADMSTCNLERSNLGEAQLVETSLDFANLKEASLFSAHLYNSYMYGADVSMAWVSMTDLRRTDLSHVQGLTQEQLDAASDGEVGEDLPEGLMYPSRWGSGRSQAQQRVGNRDSLESHSKVDVAPRRLVSEEGFSTTS